MPRWGAVETVAKQGTLVSSKVTTHENAGLGLVSFGFYFSLEGGKLDFS